jgi:glycosyltransferase involved in cell wall biosynthesis
LSSNNHLPLFSVVIATHNRAHLLPQAVQSVLKQTFEDFELIIVDDASTDKTAEVVRSFHDPRLVYLRREENGGVAAANNTGLAQAKGKYVCFLGDDDEYLPRFLKETYRVFEVVHETVGFVWSGVRWVQDTSGGETMYEDGLMSRPRFNDREQAHLSFLRQPLGTGWGATIRRSCFDQVGKFDEGLRVAVDHEFFARLVRRYDYEIIPAVLVKVHAHSGSRVSRLGVDRAKAYARIIEKNYEAIQKHRDLWVIFHYFVGSSYYFAGDKASARRFMWRVVQRNPFYPKCWLAMVLYEVLGKRAPRLHQKLSCWKNRLVR